MDEQRIESIEVKLDAVAGIVEGLQVAIEKLVEDVNTFKAMDFSGCGGASLEGALSVCKDRSEGRKVISAWCEGQGVDPAKYELSKSELEAFEKLN